MTLSQIDTIEEGRPLGQAMLRGVRCKCPACGAAPMLRAYLTVRDCCPACGEDLSHQRADDGPAYLTMLVTLKTVVPLMVYVMFNYDVNPTLLFALSALLLVAMTLFLLPRFKGMIVAIQWAKRMHGFGDVRDH